MKRIDLNGQWKMRRAYEDKFIDAKVPGSVMADLMNAGLMEDPYYRDNDEKTLEVFKYDYEYYREFIVDKELLNQDRVFVLCEGIDTISDIFVNGKLVAKTKNMHRTYELDIKELINVGENNIQVILYSPLDYIAKIDSYENGTWGSDVGSMHGFQHIRKAHCMFGWDWGPQLPDLGIWRNISIIGYSIARIKDVYIIQQHTEKQVSLEFKLDIENFQGSNLDVFIDVISPNGEVFAVEHFGVLQADNIKLNIENPELWWPNGYGEQPLYKAIVQLKGEGNILDTKTYSIGLRTMGVKREKDNWGESFEIEVNGVSIFAMGADYIPEDSILSRCNPDRTEILIKDCIEANFNCLRVWGGGYYMDDYFYDICDKYGIVIWQDMLFACATYMMTEDFSEEIIRETEDNVKRLRHHACLGLWCGNNEMEWGWEEWNFPKPTELRRDYLKQFEILLPEIIKQYDPNTFYWPASPSSGGGFDKPNDPTRGDVHWWDVWHKGKPFTDYRRFKFRFASEYGFQSLPSMKTIKSFTFPEDRNMLSYVMERHQKHPEGNGKIMNYLAQELKFPKDLRALVYASQILQAEAIKYGVEHWRRNRGICMGSVYWQLNDCWPVTSWSSIDYYGRWKALHYYAKRFHAPVLLSACDEGNTITLNVSNETRVTVKGSIEWRLVNNIKGLILRGSYDIELEALSAKDFEELDFTENLALTEDRRNTYFEYSLVIDSKVVSTANILFVKPKHFNFLNPNIQTEINETCDEFIINITSESFAKAIELDLKDNDCKFSDNYFDLSKDEQKIVLVMKKDITKQISLEEFTKELKITSIYYIA